jgi:hypothetical protein
MENSKNARNDNATRSRAAPRGGGGFNAEAHKAFANALTDSARLDDAQLLVQ